MKGSTRRSSIWSRGALAFTLVGVSAQFSGCADAPKAMTPGAGQGGGDAGADDSGGRPAAGRSNGGAANQAGATAQAGSNDSAGEAGQAPSQAGTSGGPSQAGGNGEAGQDSGMGGEGGATCDSGLVTCPGGPTCGTDLDIGHPALTTVDDCGACGVSCSLDQATSATCVSGACQPTCSTGFADCDRTSNDGCETDTTVSVSHCGACGHGCSSAGTTSRACTQQVCVPVCAPKYLDCNVDTGSSADDGCERYLDSLDQCGSTCGDGVACTGAQVCNAGACGAAQGLVEMSVPLAAASDNQRYADVFNPPPDLSNTTLYLRMYAPNATGGTLSIYMTDISSDFGPTTSVPLNTLSAGWMDIAVPIAGAQGNFDPIAMHQVTIEVMGGTSTEWATPATVVYLDHVWTTNTAVNDTFDATLGTVIGSSFQVVSGSTLTWVDSLP